MLTIAAFHSCTWFQVGCACLTSAATPATCGAAIDVPDIAVALFPDPTSVEKMLTPGAVMSGLSQLSPVRGPLEVELAKLEKPGLTIVVLVNVTVPPGPAVCRRCI